MILILIANMFFSFHLTNEIRKPYMETTVWNTMMWNTRGGFVFH